ncbi:MAG: hypothetical protein M0Q92_12615 [Methanoregula sp.]|nr:hypothetical protein [Methanoregula sp.]
MACYDSGDSQYKLTCSSCGVTAAEANRCDTITDGSYSASGVCTDSDTCTTGALYNDEGTLKASCSTGTSSDVDPCDSSAADGYSASGMCVSGSSCATGIVYLNGTTITSGCSNGGGQACYTDAQNNGSLTSWSPSGICTSGNVCTSGATTVLDSGTYYAGCSGHAGVVCDSDGGASFSADGICLSNGTCGTSGLICYDSGDSAYKDACSACSASTAEANRCDNDITGGYSAEGVCTDTNSCATGALYDDTETAALKAGCSDGTSSDVDPCEDNASDGYSASGMCVAGSTCQTGGVYLDATTITTGCSDGGGQGCYTDAQNDGSLTAWSPSGICTSGSVCTVSALTVLDSGTYYTTCTGHDNATCDSDGGGSFSADGLCLSDVCVTSGLVCQDSGDSLYYNACSACGVTTTEANRCDTDITGGYAANGVCTDTNSCTTGALYNDGTNLKAGCSDGTSSNVDPCEDDASDGYSASGMCVSGSTCVAGIVYLNGTTITNGCTNGGGQACYTGTQNDGSLTSWSPSGICTSGSVCTADALTVLDTGVYYATCTGHDNATCDSDGGGSFSADGLCLSDTCVTSGLVCQDSGDSLYYNACSACGVTAAEANRCDTDITGGYVANGVCTDTNSCTTGALYNDGTNLKAGCSDGATSNVDPCEDDASDGYAPYGMCVSGSTCVAGIVYLNGTTITNGCTNGGGQACYTGTQNDGSLTSWSPSGICTSGSVCTADALTVLDTGVYYATCSAHAGQSCDFDGGGSFSASGVCLSDTSCDTTAETAQDCNYSESCTGASYYSSCGSVNDNDRCDTDITDGSFAETGVCVAGACVALAGNETGNCSDVIDNDGDGGLDMYDTDCNTVPGAPTLVFPPNNTTTDDPTPTLRAAYSDPENAGYTDYRIVSTSYADCLNGANVVISGRSSKTILKSETTQWTPPLTLGASSAYYWCARNFDTYVYSDWTAMGSFTLNLNGIEANAGIKLNPGGGGFDMWGVEWK